MKRAEKRIRRLESIVKDAQQKTRLSSEVEAELLERIRQGVAKAAEERAQGHSSPRLDWHERIGKMFFGENG
jgi:hypothetical protein